jgi:hypothetical protein
MMTMPNIVTSVYTPIAYAPRRINEHSQLHHQHLQPPTIERSALREPPATLRPPTQPNNWLGLGLNLTAATVASIALWKSLQNNTSPIIEKTIDNTRTIVQQVEKQTEQWLAHLNITPLEKMLDPIANIQLSTAYHIVGKEGSSFTAANNAISVKRALSNFSHVFAPDTHGNTLKALLDAVVGGAIEMSPKTLDNLSKVYQELSQVLTTNEFSNEEKIVKKQALLTQFKTLLQECTKGERFKPTSIKPNVFIQGGDTIADASLDDMFSLLYSNRMRELGGTQYVSLNSNHDMTALFELIRQENPNANLADTLISSKKRQSFDTAFKLIANTDTTGKQRLIQLYADHLKALDLIHVAVKQAGKKAEVAIFTHAGGDRSHFEAILTEIKENPAYQPYADQLTAIAETNETLLGRIENVEKTATVVNQWHRAVMNTALQSVDGTTPISENTNRALALIFKFVDEYAPTGEDTEDFTPLVNPATVQAPVFSVHGHNNGGNGDNQYNKVAGDIKIRFFEGETDGDKKYKYTRHGLNNNAHGEDSNVTRAPIGAF